ncbi:putative phage anti-repressor protein [Staphylococcus aureus]|nr:putative phage anti-repressor protein [Staphylococcus aureus]
MPTQYSMERELFEIKETSITHSDGHTSISKTPKVTGKGQQYFVNKFFRRKTNILKGGIINEHTI